ncbi:MAG: hypothetical protein HYX44_11640 [Aquabacterium sp.]|nr:hypothetical protein [Aquabacterium sp.]
MQALLRKFSRLNSRTPGAQMPWYLKKASKASTPLEDACLARARGKTCPAPDPNVERMVTPFLSWPGAQGWNLVHANPPGQQTLNVQEFQQESGRPKF